MTRERDCSKNVNVQRAFDGEQPHDDVAGHLVDCNPCGGSLRTLQVQQDALQFLSTDLDDGAVQPVIHRVLASTAQAGREQLADLLYELSKACLILNETGQLRTLRILEPRSAETVYQSLTRASSRVSVQESDLSEAVLPSQELDFSRALESAKHCIAILENVEGRSSRQQLMLSGHSNAIGNFNEAIQVCRNLLTQSIHPDHRGYAYANLTCALNREGRFDEALEVGEQAARQFPHHFMIAYNQVITLAWLKRPDEFERSAGRLAKLLEDRALWKEDIIRQDLSEISGQLGFTEGELLPLFGLSTSQPGGS